MVSVNGKNSRPGSTPMVKFIKQWAFIFIKAHSLMSWLNRGDLLFGPVVIIPLCVHKMVLQHSSSAQSPSWQSSTRQTSWIHHQRRILISDWKNGSHRVYFFLPNLSQCRVSLTKWIWEGVEGDFQFSKISLLANWVMKAKTSFSNWVSWGQSGENQG